MLVENIKKESFTHVFAGHSAFGKSLMPRVAAILDSQQISDITAIESDDSRFSQDLVESLADHISSFCTPNLCRQCNSYGQVIGQDQNDHSEKYGIRSS